jgi:hypothetical protein
MAEDLRSAEQVEKLMGASDDSAQESSLIDFHHGLYSSARRADIFQYAFPNGAC